MRAVRSATWTSVDPVSASPRPYLATISRFFSAARLMRRETVAGISLVPRPTKPGASDDQGPLRRLRDHGLGRDRRLRSWARSTRGGSSPATGINDGGPLIAGAGATQAREAREPGSS